MPGDVVSYEENGGGGIVEGVMPAAGGDTFLQSICDPGVSAGMFESVLFFRREAGSGEMERIDPGAKAMTGKGAEKALLGATGVGDKHRLAKAIS